ncbi:hypothetical protein [Bradyrhizobium sp. CB2312]|uniref:hypothetical protein n=1 Tax=Bradyrhizobium sp. CB2312 TaxID=3039155 RepID=UPI0024B18F14|nr:hypothetical protein [Bradyrhizobium sp. CB2312]WFU69475.1 hypothetical protein QA642_29860 [Bradyrhizobium sp. CB2312]
MKQLTSRWSRGVVMRTASPLWVGRFRDIVARIGAAFREQREIEARRALRRYRHLLEPAHETLPLNQFIPVSKQKDISEHAHGSDACERAAGAPAFERA